ncbi:VWA domain-containing protein [Vibrio sp. CyArs1]|uniref:vWA domain-containing protein n=1 Tax=Vibrio sp. CyArs1 TaxID=2682577 RepID=UPI001F064A9A|nr:VWA domain-containing protein [Vibrio sp. CyArs1]
MALTLFGTTIFFLSPAFLWFLIPIALLACYLFWQARVGSEKSSAIAPHLLKLLTVKASRRTSILTPSFVVLVVMLLLAFVLARPVWAPKSSTYYPNSPLFIVLDVSNSMRKTDVQPSRLDKAKLLLEQLLQSGVSRPVSIVAFSGSSHQLVPFTDDAKIDLLYLSYLSPSVMPLNGGDVASLERLMSTTLPEDSESIDMLFLTDGGLDDPQTLKTYLSQKKVTSHVIYFGPLGEQVAKSISSNRYDGGSSNVDILTLRTSLFELIARGHSSSEGLADESHWLLVFIVALSSLWFRKGWALRFSWFVMVPFLWTPYVEANIKDVFLTKDQQAMIYMYFGDYKSAESLFENEEWRAVSCYYQEKFQCAEKSFVNVGSVEGTYNAANALAQRGIYKKAQSYYQAVLAIEPNNKEAQHNLKIVEGIIKKIDRLSQSYDDSRPPQQNESKPPPDEDEIANGKKQTVIGVRPVSSLKAQDVLANKAATDKWLRDVSKDPEDFIRRKFLNEFNRGKSSE